MAMPTSGMKMIDKIIHKARNAKQVDLENFYNKILKATRDIEKLRQLFLILHFSKSRQLPDDVANALLATVCDKSTPPRIVQTCLLILSEALPLPVLQLKALLGDLDDKNVIKVLPLLQAQTIGAWNDTNVGSRLLEFLRHSLNASDHMAVLIFLHKMLNEKSLLQEGEMDFLNDHFVAVLRKTSTYQILNPYASTLFKRNDRPPLVTELDGKATQEFFTVLNLADYNSDDQFVNVCAFSLVRKWLTVQSRMSGGGELRPTCQHLVRNVNEYCIRLIDQSYLVVENENDAPLQNAGLLEAIYLMDLLCQLYPSMSASVFVSMKRLQQKLVNNFQGQPQMSILFTAFLKFLLQHAEAVAFDVESTLQTFFLTHVPHLFRNNNATFEHVQFLLDNASVLQQKYECFTKYFPAIFKILAWNPQTFLEDFMQILPACISNSTVIELFHLLLDLPCVSASLLMRELCSRELSSTTKPSQIQTLSRKSWNDPQFQPMFTFMLRNSSGKGDTFNRLKDFHELTKGLQSEWRVIYCADLAPIMLRLFFRKLGELNDINLYCRLVPVMFERVHLLYPISKFTADIEQVLVEEMLAIFKQCPSLIILVSADLLDYIPHLRNIKEAELFYTHVLWIIGEYLSPSYNKDCSFTTIASFYNVLECVVYELLKDLQSSGLHIKLLSTIATTLAKLATRNQDMFPRSKLCLSKMNARIVELKEPFKSEEIKIVAGRIKELMMLLRTPSVASIILHPPAEIEEKQLHYENTSVPFVLKSISGILAARAEK